MAAECDPVRAMGSGVGSTTLSTRRVVVMDSGEQMQQVHTATQHKG